MKDAAPIEHHLSDALNPYEFIILIRGVRRVAWFTDWSVWTDELFGAPSSIIG